MKQRKKWIGILCVIQMAAMLAAGCGRNMNAESKSDATTTAPGITTESTAQNGDPDLNDNTAGNGNTDMNSTDSTVQNNDSAGNGNTDQTKKDENKSGNDLGAAGNAVENAAEGVGEAVDDVADGIGDAVDNLGAGAFDTYEDARDYLLGKLSEDNASAHYELREEKKDLVSYNDNDADAQGYEFSVYETDGNEKIGRYYVDKETGKIYRYMGKKSIEAY